MRVRIAVLAGVLLFVVGCHSPNACTHPDTGVSIQSYVNALDEVKGNLKKIKSGYEEALDKAVPAYVPDLRNAKLEFVDATVTVCDDALKGAGAVLESKPDAGAGADQ